MPLEIMGTFLVWAATSDHVDVQWLYRTFPTFYWLWRAGPAPFLGSIVELVLVLKMQVTSLQGRDCEKADPALSAIGWCGCRGDAHPPTPCHFLQSSWESCPWVMKVEELALPLAGCSTWESRLSTWPEQHRRGGPGGGGTGKPAPKGESVGILVLTYVRLCRGRAIPLPLAT